MKKNNLKLLSLIFLSLVNLASVQSQQIFQPVLLGIEALTDTSKFYIIQYRLTNGDTTWINSSKKVADPLPYSGYYKSNIDYYWVNQDWLHYIEKKDSLVVDGQNRLIEVYNFTLNASDPGLSSCQKTLNTYENNKLVNIRMQTSAAGSLNTFVDLSNTFRKYNAEGQRIEDSLYIYSSNKASKTVYIYNQSGEVTFKFTTAFPTNDTTYRGVYTYLNNKLITSFEESYNKVLGKWEPEYSDTLDYNTAGLVSKRIQYVLMTEQNQPIPTFQPLYINDFFYHQDKRIDYTLSQSWDKNSKKWNKTSKSIYMYNAAKNNELMQVGSHPFVGGNSYTPIPYNRYTFGTYTGITNNDILPQPPVVYPNPATDQIHIGLNGNLTNGKVRITDLLGQQVHTALINNTQELVVDVSTLKNGIYLVFLETNQGTSVAKKMVVSHP